MTKSIVYLEWDELNFTDQFAYLKIKQLGSGFTSHLSNHPANKYFLLPLKDKRLMNHYHLGNDEN